jgi:glycogen debranching enzyme
MGPVVEREEGSGIVRPDGTAPAPPLADADCQAAAIAALDALARLDPAGEWAARAAALRAAVTARFVPPGIGSSPGAGSSPRAGSASSGGSSSGAGAGEWPMAIEGDGRVVPGAGSQLGWLLWAGALEGDAAAAAAERLVQPDVLTDFGLRTLSAAHPAFRPHAYHRGGIWPFDSWLGWSGLRAAGRTTEAERVRAGVLTALDRLGLAPELFAVTAAGELEPVPISNRVQAWTVGARWAFEHDWDGRG